MVKQEDSLFGVRYWRQEFQNRVPRFEVFLYVGYFRTTKQFLFISRDESTLLRKTLIELHKGDFKPFLIDMKKVTPFFTGEKALTNPDGTAIIE